MTKTLTVKDIKRMMDILISEGLEEAEVAYMTESEDLYRLTDLHDVITDRNGKDIIVVI